MYILKYIANPPTGAIAVSGSFALSSAPTLRSSAVQQVSSASSCTLTLPSGTSVGDTVFLFIGHGYSSTTPSGWTALQNSGNVSYWCNQCSYKVMTAGDISTGSVAVSFSGTFDGVVAAVCLTGGSSSFTRYGYSSQGVFTFPNVFNFPCQVGDQILLFGSARTSGMCTISAGTTLQSASNGTDAACKLNLLTATQPQQSVSFSYSVAPTGNGDFQAAIYIPSTASFNGLLHTTFGEYLRWTSGSLDGGGVPQQTILAATPFNWNYWPNPDFSPEAFTLNGSNKGTLFHLFDGALTKQQKVAGLVGISMPSLLPAKCHVSIGM